MTYFDRKQNERYNPARDCDDYDPDVARGQLREHRLLLHPVRTCQRGQASAQLLKTLFKSEKIFSCSVQNITIMVLGG